VQLTALLPEPAFTQPEEPNVMHSQQRCTFGLLSTADFRNLAARDDWIEATCLTVRQDAVRDLGPSIRPPSYRATSPKLSVIRMGDNH
jgi:hypothetical protein